MSLRKASILARSCRPSGFESASSNAFSCPRQAAARSWFSRTREAKAPGPEAKRVPICWTAAAAED
jgi:hypothetical protein